MLCDVVSCYAADYVDVGLPGQDDGAPSTSGRGAASQWVKQQVDAQVLLPLIRGATLSLTATAGTTWYLHMLARSKRLGNYMIDAGVKVAQGSSTQPDWYSR
jgi:hypothetical protein